MSSFFIEDNKDSGSLLWCLERFLLEVQQHLTNLFICYRYLCNLTNPYVEFINQIFILSSDIFSYYALYE